LNPAQTQCPKQDLTEKGESDHAAALPIANDQLRCRFARFESWLTFWILMLLVSVRTAEPKAHLKRSK
jgi:hypothetical protein